MLVFYSTVPYGQSFVAISRADGSQKSQDTTLEGEVCEVPGCTLLPAVSVTLKGKSALSPCI